MRRGVSLVETLLAATLAGVVLVLVLNLFPSSMATVRKAEQRTRASALADSLLEARLTLPFRDLPVGYQQDLPDLSADGLDYRRRFTVAAVPGESSDHLRALHVKVTWVYRDRTLELDREVWKHRLPSEKL